METLTDFLRNAGLLSLLNILVAAILILAGIVMLIVARSRRTMYSLIATALLPLLLGLLTMYLYNRALDRGVFYMFPTNNAEAIAAGRRAALINGCIGAAAATVVVLIGMLGLILKAERKG